MAVQMLQKQLQVADQPVGGVLGARQRRLITGTGGNGFESSANAAAYHNWPSPDEATLVVSANPTTLSYEVDYALAPATLPDGTRTDFVRVRIWNYSDADVGTAYTATVQPFVNGSTRGTAQLTFGPGGASNLAQESFFDLPTDADGTAWTITAVLSYRWGFSIAGTSVASASIYLAGITKLLVEMWGPTPPTVYTPVPTAATAYTPIITPAGTP